MKKLIYEAPESEFIQVRFEMNLLASGESASLGGMMTGGSGASGYNGDAFDSSSNHHQL